MERLSWPIKPQDWIVVNGSRVQGGSLTKIDRCLLRSDGLCFVEWPVRVAKPGINARMKTKMKLKRPEAPFASHWIAYTSLYFLHSYASAFD